MHQDHTSRRIHQLATTDSYLIEVPVVMTGSMLHALADTHRLPRPIWPPQLLHAAMMTAGFDALSQSREEEPR